MFIRRICCVLHSLRLANTYCFSCSSSCRWPAPPDRRGTGAVVEEPSKRASLSAREMAAGSSGHRRRRSPLGRPIARDLEPRSVVGRPERQRPLDQSSASRAPRRHRSGRWRIPPTGSRSTTVRTMPSCGSSRSAECSSSRSPRRSPLLVLRQGGGVGDPPLHVGHDLLQESEPISQRGRRLGVAGAGVHRRGTCGRRLAAERHEWRRLIGRCQRGATRSSLLFDLFAASQRVRSLLVAAMDGVGLKPDEYAVYSALL